MASAKTAFRRLAGDLRCHPGTDWKVTSASAINLCRRRRFSSSAADFNLIRYDFCNESLNTVGIGIFAIGQMTYHEDLTSLSDVLLGQGGKASPGYDVMPRGIINFSSIMRLVLASGAKREGCLSDAVLTDRTDFRILATSAKKMHLIY